MDNISAKVKEAYDQSLPKEAYLSDQEKQAIRNRIQTIKKEQPKLKTKKTRDLLPKTLTAIVAAGFLLFVGGVIEKEFNQPSNLQSGEKGDSSAPSQQKNEQENDLFSKFEIGDIVNGWTLVNKVQRHGVSNYPSGLWVAEFSGSQIITGKLTYNKEHGLVFFPEDNSKKSLPIIGQQKQKSFVKFTDQFEAEKILGLKHGEERAHISIEIDQYTFNYKENLVVPDTVHLVNLIGADGKEVRHGTKLQIDDAGHIQLSNRLQKVYSTFSKTKQTSALKDLSPFDIFQLYYYMEDQNDYQTQYLLYIDDPEYLPTFKTVDEYVKTKNQTEEQQGQSNLLEMIKAAKLEENITGDAKNAHISISKELGLGFSLTKNQNGIWMVNWMPLQ